MSLPANWSAVGLLLCALTVFNSNPTNKQVPNNLKYLRFIYYCLLNNEALTSESFFYCFWVTFFWFFFDIRIYSGCILSNYLYPIVNGFTPGSEAIDDRVWNMKSVIYCIVEDCKMGIKLQLKAYFSSRCRENLLAWILVQLRDGDKKSSWWKIRCLPGFYCQTMCR